ncbi:hypothetical protein [Desertivirga brevis]|uniref:hypothetical protein n=1 Tax=Desertivirga brevis TaxID=2810310 RepID=UPI001A9607E6|nr:hypothetical protein [Pedobacter sp. SYSU D00873]
MLETFLSSGLLVVGVLVSQYIFGFYSRRRAEKYKLQQVEPQLELKEVKIPTQTSMSFINSSAEVKKFWIEPFCVEFNVDKDWEFLLVKGSDDYTVDFESDVTIIWLSGGFKLFKRPVYQTLPNPNKWELEVDYSKS